MTRSERSRCVRWRLGWLPHDTHNRLQMPKSIDDPLSYLLNLLPPTLLTKKARKSIYAWLIPHSQFPEASNHLGEPFVKRLHYIQQKFSDS
ncbi:hypothetical protein BCV72DRAFT_325674 [Rhizopus microsporus var. microsporus]|uniref:Uncharacterized protein n=1 Tax=Rhizopus microsporus var. microsporus TaxID=86635 RepID=A0A1X0R6Z6_RHIZD|nr:hypothetical protein BCV72DRAFT_325674 [Rhizopus microsporus var. microsporus]